LETEFENLVTLSEADSLEAAKELEAAYEKA
jgi:hypothetical protein